MIWASVSFRILPVWYDPDNYESTAQFMGNKYRSDGISNYSVRHESYPCAEYIRLIIPSFLHTSAKTQKRCRFFVRKLGASKNRGTPKSSILIRFSIINHPFWGTPIFGNTQLYNYSDEDFVVTLFVAKLLIQTVAGPAKNLQVIRSLSYLMNLMSYLQLKERQVT